jgi:ATP-binding cassette subfamily F protein uup
MSDQRFGHYDAGCAGEYLKNFGGCVIIVSHERYFMDRLSITCLCLRGMDGLKISPKLLRLARETASGEQAEKGKPNLEAKEAPKPARVRERKMTFNEKREFEQLKKT